MTNSTLARVQYAFAALVVVSLLLSIMTMFLAMYEGSYASIATIVSLADIVIPIFCVGWLITSLLRPVDG